MGSLIAPLLATALGGTGALVLLGLVVLAYALNLLRQAQPAPAAASACGGARACGGA